MTCGRRVEVETQRQNHVVRLLTETDFFILWFIAEVSFLAHTDVKADHPARLCVPVNTHLKEL